MTAPSNYPWSFRTVCAVDSEKACVLAGHDETSEVAVPATAVYAWAGRWFNTIAPLIAASASCDPTPHGQVLIMGIDGRIFRWGSELFEEFIDASTTGPQHIGDLREIRQVANAVYVVGMGRTVYVRKAAGEWTRIDESIRVKPGEVDKGLNSIHGYSAEELYAVGFDGELWRYDGKSWSAIDSPTNSILYRVVCAPDGFTYAFGQSGVVLRGRGNDWIALENDVTDETIWGATAFKDTVYASTVNGMYVIDDEKLGEYQPKLNKKNAKIAPGLSFYHLDANDTRMWSAGRKMVMWTEDAKIWTETPYS